MQKRIYSLKSFTGCLILTVLLLCGCAGGNDLEITTASHVEETTAGTEAVAGTETVAEAEENTATVFVQVMGAVHAPGVYELPAGSRVFEAVEMAGGMTKDAAPESLNQALELMDGQMIVLYTCAEWEAMQADGTDDGAGNIAGDGAAQEDGRVNINTATLDELCSIPGIGQSRAQSIITYREQNGAFGSIEDIMKVSGIKDGLFQKIKDKIKV